MERGSGGENRVGVGAPARLDKRVLNPISVRPSKNTSLALVFFVRGTRHLKETIHFLEKRLEAT